MDAVLEKIQLNTLLAGSLLACLIFFPKFIQQVHGITLSNECACPGDTLIYECTVVGVPNGATIWRGTAFECLSNEIALLHSRFVNGTLNFGICNNGAIVARSLSVEGNNYTSQLNVTVTPDTAAKTIICFNDDPFNSTIQFSTVTPNFTTVITDPLPPPDRLYISSADFSVRELTFTWSPVGPGCPATYYNILASNCGSCPTTTNYTTVTCTQVPTDGSVCTFAIQTVVCENITGNISYQIRVNTTIPLNTLGILNSSTSRAYIISISSLATALIISVIVSITMTLIIIAVTRRKVKIKAGVDLQLTSRTERSTNVESAYDNVTGLSSSVSAIHTHDNVAYMKPSTH